MPDTKLFSLILLLHIYVSEMMLLHVVTHVCMFADPVLITFNRIIHTSETITVIYSKTMFLWVPGRPAKWDRMLASEIWGSCRRIQGSPWFLTPANFEPYIIFRILGINHKTPRETVLKLQQFSLQIPCMYQLLFAHTLQNEKSLSVSDGRPTYCVASPMRKS